MTAVGQTEKSGCSTGRSALPSITDIVRPTPHVRKVATCDIEVHRPKEKPPCGGLSNPKLRTDQATAILFLRRYAMKPRPANPRIIIAHVEGSGTAATELSANTAMQPSGQIGLCTMLVEPASGTKISLEIGSTATERALLSGL